MPHKTALERKRDLVSEAITLVGRAAHLIRTPNHWTRDHWALDRRGRPVELTSAQATRVCLLGSVYRAEHELHGTDIVMARPQSIELRTPPPTRVSAVVDLLSNFCRDDLASRFDFRFVNGSEREDSDVGPVRLIDWRELPIAYNGAGFLGQRDMHRALQAVAIVLFYLQSDDDMLRKCVRLPKPERAT